MIERKRTGVRRIELLAPFEAGCGHIIDALELRPVTLDIVLRWQSGAIDGPMALLAELAGVTGDILGLMTYPDCEIVLNEFSLHCPAAIRHSVASAPSPPIHAATIEERMPSEPQDAGGDDQEAEGAAFDPKSFAA